MTLQSMVGVLKLSMALFALKPFLSIGDLDFQGFCWTSPGPGLSLTPLLVNTPGPNPPLPAGKSRTNLPIEGGLRCGRALAHWRTASQFWVKAACRTDIAWPLKRSSAVLHSTLRHLPSSSPWASSQWPPAQMCSNASLRTPSQTLSNPTGPTGPRGKWRAQRASGLDTAWRKGDPREQRGDSLERTD